MTKQLSWYKINIFGFQLLSHLESDHLFTSKLRDDVSSILHNIYFPSSQKHYQKRYHLFIMWHMVIPFSFTFKSPVLPKTRVCPISFKVIQILNSAVSGEMLQVPFSFQNSDKATYVKRFFNFKSVLHMFIQTMISFSQRF